MEDRPIRLGSRAFDVLMALVEAHGTVVSKNALLARVWPDQVVGENNLEVQISALRTIFGEERALIRTVFRRGYQFTGELLSLAESPVSYVDATTTLAEPQAGRPPTNLAESISELIGRDDDLPEVLRLAALHRLVTLTGAGGIGKTRLALEAARRLLPEFANEVWLAELSPIVDPGHVSATVATALRLDLSGRDVSARRVAQALANRRTPARAR